MELANRTARNRAEYPRMNRYTWIWCLAASLVAVVMLFTLWFFSVQAGDEGMVPTVEQNDVILFDRLSKTFRTPRRGDILAFSDSLGQGVYLGRVVGLPGETVTIRQGSVYIDGARLEEPYCSGLCPDMEDILVRQGAFLLLPDQRELADDSNGENLIVGAERILGRAFLRVSPWGRIALFR